MSASASANIPRLQLLTSSSCDPGTCGSPACSCAVRARTLRKASRTAESASFAATCADVDVAFRLRLSQCLALGSQRFEAGPLCLGEEPSCLLEPLLCSASLRKSPQFTKRALSEFPFQCRGCGLGGAEQADGLQRQRAEEAKAPVPCTEAEAVLAGHLAGQGDSREPS